MTTMSNEDFCDHLYDAQQSMQDALSALRKAYEYRGMSYKMSNMTAALEAFRDLVEDITDNCGDDTVDREYEQWIEEYAA